MSAPGLGDRLRWLARRAAPVCRSCEGELTRGARWCGRCGARVGAAPAASDVAPAVEAPVTTATSPPRRTRVVAAVALLGLVGAALAAGLARDPAPVALLGTAAGTGGQSASGPPPAGLRLAWSVPLVGDVGRSQVGGPPWLVVGQERLAIDGRVAELATGRLVGTVPAVAAVGADGVGVAVGDGELVRVRALDGTVVGRTVLPDDASAGVRVVVRVGDVTVVSDEVAGRTTLLADDGTVVARHTGTLDGAVDRAVGTPAAVSVRRGAGTDADSTLVATDDGAVVAELAAAGPMAVDVVGDRALVVTAASDALGRPGTGIVWGLRLVDAADGRQLARAQVVSAVAPRLLGTFDDGTVAVATRSGREVGLWRLRPDGGVDAIAQLRRNVLRTGVGADEDAMLVGASAMLRSVAMLDGLLVLPDDGAGRAVAVDRTGAVQWARPAPGAASVAAAGGHVVLVDVDGRARVLDATDGSDVATVAATDDRTGGTVPVAVLGTDLALARPAGGRLDVSLGTTRWVDVATGEPRTVDEVLGDVVPPDDPVSGAWRFVGVTSDPVTGRPVPVVLRDLGRDVVQVLDPRAGFRGIDLDQPDAGDVASFLARVVGTTERRVALWTDSFEGRAASVTHVLDRTTGAVVHLPGVIGVDLRADVLLGADDDRLVGLDPATGAERWHAALPGGAAAVDDRHLVDIRLDGVAALDLADGRSVWDWRSDVALTGTPVLGTTLVAVTTVAGEVVALDRDTGGTVWRTAVGGPVTAMTAAGDHVLVGTADGLVVHLDARGRAVQRMTVGTGPVRSVAALGTTVVAVVDGAAVGLRADGSGVVRRDEVELP